jgi:prepilin-type N-terminal cleavage/methylation domain-containing protein
MKTNIIKNNQKGFTLAELIIVVAIIAIISVISMFNSAKLNSSILLSNTAYEIGLIIRDAQISGLGVKVISSSGNATTSNQGIFFDISTPEKIIFFADLNKNDKYDVGIGEEWQVYNIENKRAGKILSICKIGPNNTICKPISNGGDITNLQNLNVIFKRPNPESYFYYNDGNNKEYSGSVVINIGFDPGDCRSILIYKTGAVQIDRSFCPAII